MAHMLSEEHLARKNIDISAVSYENLVSYLLYLYLVNVFASYANRSPEAQL